MPPKLATREVGIKSAQLPARIVFRNCGYREGFLTGSTPVSSSSSGTTRRCGLLRCWVRLRVGKSRLAPGIETIRPVSHIPAKWKGAFPSSKQRCSVRASVFPAHNQLRSPLHNVIRDSVIAGLSPKMISPSGTAVNTGFRQAFRHSRLF